MATTIATSRMFAHFNSRETAAEPMTSTEVTSTTIPEAGERGDRVMTTIGSDTSFLPESTAVRGPYSELSRLESK